MSNALQQAAPGVRRSHIALHCPLLTHVPVCCFVSCFWYVPPLLQACATQLTPTTHKPPCSTRPLLSTMAVSKQVSWIAGRVSDLVQKTRQGCTPWCADTGPTVPLWLHRSTHTDSQCWWDHQPALLGVLQQTASSMCRSAARC
jgi:hypothetical protein